MTDKGFEGALNDSDVLIADMLRDIGKPAVGLTQQAAIGVRRMSLTFYYLSGSPFSWKV